MLIDRHETAIGQLNPGLVQAFAQGEGLGELGNTQPVGTAFQGGERNGEQAVPVGVGLDGRELERAGGGGYQQQPTGGSYGGGYQSGYSSAGGAGSNPTEIKKQKIWSRGQ